MPKRTPRVYSLKVDLLGADVPVWRRVHVAPSTTLPALHEVLQIAMGWDNYHLHQFIVGERRYTVPGEDPPGGGVDEYGVALGSLLVEPGQSLLYEYDFGDGWEHLVTLEAVLDADPRVAYPVCTGGEGACPPEDCGGIDVYNDTRAAYTDPTHPEHTELLRWLGYAFDPDGFDTNAVNRHLTWRVKRSMPYPY